MGIIGEFVIGAFIVATMLDALMFRVKLRLYDAGST